MEQVKLLSMTALLTLVIWAGADSLVNETVSVHVRFEPTPSAAAPRMIVEPSPDAAVYELKIAGRRSAIQTIREKAPLTVRFPLPDLPTGSNRFLLDRDTLKAQLIQQWSEFKQITIVDVEPDTLALSVDHWVDRDVRLVLAHPARAYDVEPQLQRSTVSVRMRESVLQTLPPDEPLQLDITAAFERLLTDSPAGESITVTVPLDPAPFGPGAVLTPPSVQVTATLRPQYRTAEIATVPVLVAVSFANLEKPYRAVTRDGTPLTLVTQTIKVKGPAEAVARLKRGASRAFGVIHLKQNDLDQLGVLRPFTAEYYLPDGLQLAEPPPPIEFQLVLVEHAP
ncbi:MAG: hypothetical protein D6788_08525 [Planctomycetota bacterium]|nr:MAG: hypothetical protein D6788_08525 [Planctomycetota bacterium]